MNDNAHVTGVGMVLFQKPGASESFDITAVKAARVALKDAGLLYDQIQQACVGYVYGDSTFGGKYVTNPSGGLLGKGHSLGATGLAHCTELVQQLHGTADARQVDGTLLALQHNLGLGGSCVVTQNERA